MDQPVDTLKTPPEYRSPHGPACCPPPRPPRPPRRRIGWYFVCMLILNILLGFYALYAIGLVLQFNWYAPADSVPILEIVWMVILAFSPLLLTVILNRILYRAFRGRRRFPRGTALLALLVLIIVQALTIMLTLRYGLVEGATGIGMGDYVQFFSEITG